MENHLQESISKKQYPDPTNLNLRRALFNFSLPKISITEKALDLLKLNGKEDILEVGCGEGKVPLLLRQKRKHRGRIVGLDMNKGMFTKTKKLAKKYRINPEIEFMEGRADNLSFMDDSFDILLSFYMLYHVPNMQKALLEWKRVLKPNGKLLIATNSSENRPKLYKFKNLIGRLTCCKPPANFSSRFSLESGPRKLKKHFTIIKQFTYNGKVILSQPQSYLDAMESYRSVFSPLPSDTAWKNAIATVKSIIQKEINTKGYFMDKAKTGFFICSKK